MWHTICVVQILYYFHKAIQICVWFSGTTSIKHNLTLVRNPYAQYIIWLHLRWVSDYIVSKYQYECGHVSFSAIEKAPQKARSIQYLLMWSYTGTFILTKQTQIPFTLQNRKPRLLNSVKSKEELLCKMWIYQLVKWPWVLRVLKDGDLRPHPVY